MIFAGVFFPSKVDALIRVCHYGCTMYVTIGILFYCHQYLKSYCSFIIIIFLSWGVFYLIDLYIFLKNTQPGPFTT